MDLIRKERKALRGLFTNAAKKFDAEPEETIFRQVCDKAERLFLKDAEFMALLLSSEDDQDVINAEYESIETYRDKHTACCVKMDLMRGNVNKDDDFESVNSEPGGSSASGCCRKSEVRNYQLPKLTLKAFDLSLKNWLQFYSQFERIHLDTELTKNDKLQYLLQTLEPGTKGRSIAENYPASDANYDKVFDELKSRFGRDELIVEVYIRELIELVEKKSDGNFIGLFDKLSSKVNCLETLGVTTCKYAAMLLPLLESALPMETLVAWERYQAHEKIKKKPIEEKMKILMEFLREEVETLERIEVVRSSFKKTTVKSNPPHIQEHQSTATASALFSQNKAQSNCLFCGLHRETKDCRKSEKMTLEERRNIVMKKGACFLCFGVNHRVRECPRKEEIGKCPNNCDGWHDVKLCAQIVETTKTMVNNNNRTVLLQTLLANVVTGDNKRRVRILFDSGSQRSYILERTAIELNLPKCSSQKLSHGLFGGVDTNIIDHAVYKVSMCGLRSDELFTCELLGQNKICSEVPRLSDLNQLPNLKRMGVFLTDFGPDNPEIDILLGSDVIPYLISDSFRTLNDGLVAWNTKLGWTVFGQVVNNSNNKQTVNTMCLLTNVKSPVGADPVYPVNEWTFTIEDEIDINKQVAENFRKTVSVNEITGHYCVHFPWKVGRKEKLTDHRVLCEARLLSLTRKLKKLNLFGAYDDIFRNWEREKYIEKVKKEGFPVHYVPHQIVIKNDSMTTKIRPVFDCSAKIANGVSLNDCLEKGPNLIHTIPAILLQFRLREIGLSADIRQAFLRIELFEMDRNFLQFLWWKDDTCSEMEIWRHRVVVFGAAPSPFLLGATLAYHLENVECHAATRDILKGSFYVDNCLTSVDDKLKYEMFRNESIEIMESGHFDLRQWAHTILPDRPNDFECCVNSSGINRCVSNANVSVLGIIWNCNEDTLCCKDSVTHRAVNEIVTMRKLLSVAHSLYDPIGFTIPLTLTPKILLRECWKRNISWDSLIPSDLEENYKAWEKGMTGLDRLRIPRWCHGERARGGSLHVFSDASKDACAACVFLRVPTSSSDTVSVQLLEAKMRISPTKNTTIPRLELIAALMGAQLSNSIRQILPYFPVYHWTDSSVVLCWIRRDNEKWNVFVGNRVDNIRKLTDVTSWHFVPGKMNPADLPTRGATVDTLMKLKWWEGPKWLHDAPEYWPSSAESVDESEVLLEKKMTATIVLAVNDPSANDALFAYFSSYRKTVRMLAWMRRWKSIVSKKKKNELVKSGLLDPEEEIEAEKCIIKLIQQSNIEEISNLPTSKDADGVIRTETKLIHGPFPEAFRRPIVLPDKHVLVLRLIQNMHFSMGHPGVQTLMCSLREKFWIPRLRRLVKAVTRNCFACRRHRVTAASTPTAALPPERLWNTTAFDVCGVDNAGPMILRNGEKTWITLFTCAVYRCVHLELVQSLSTEAYLLSLRRFVGRRGRPRVMFSDCGSNLVSAGKLLASAKCTSVEEIQFRHNVATGSWWGGFYERLIGMLKELLKRNLGNSRLNYEELMTVLIDCERTINSRPLTYVGDDVSDLRPLTPENFLLDPKHLTGDTFDIDKIETSQFEGRQKYRMKLLDGIRQRFQKEYLSTLIQRPTRDKIRRLQIGNVVLIGADNKKRIEWPLGIVTELIAGRDGEIRVVKLKTAKGTLTRPVQRVYPMELSAEGTEWLDNIPTSTDETVDSQEMEQHDQDESEQDDDPDPGEEAESIGQLTRRGREIKKPRRLDLLLLDRGGGCEEMKTESIDESMAAGKEEKMATKTFNV